MVSEGARSRICRRMAVTEGRGKHELERQIRYALFERTVVHPAKVLPLVREIHGAAAVDMLSPVRYRWSNSQSAQFDELLDSAKSCQSLLRFILKVMPDTFTTFAGKRLAC